MALIGLSCVVVLVAIGSASGQQSGDLPARLERLKQAADKDPSLSSELKSAIADVADGLQRRVPAGAAEPSALDKIFQKLRFSGDFRLRHETDFHLDDRESRNRERFRLRFGAEYDLNEPIIIGARLATGATTDENSPHQNLGESFDKKPISLDRAFATWKPEFLAGAWLTAGKFAHPFETNPVFAELVWDADIQPEGVAAAWKHAFADGGDIALVAGEYLLLDNSTNSSLESASAWVAQVSAHQKLGDHDRLLEAVGVYRYQRLNPDDINGSRLVGENNGNLLVDTNGDAILDDFASRFTIWNPILALEDSTLGPPVTFAAEYVWNPRARHDADIGWSTGVKVGRNKAMGDWQVYYEWQVMEQDAVLSSFTNDDFLFGTNFRGHLFGARYQLLDKTELHVWASAMRRDDLGTTKTTDSDKLQWRARIDVNFRF